jgi:ketosteroid isomerase-like protein
MLCSLESKVHTKETRCTVNSIDPRTGTKLLSVTRMPFKVLKQPARPRVLASLLGVATLVLVAAPEPLLAGQPAGTPTSMGRGQRHESRHEIDQLEDQWRQAVLKPNPAVIENLLAEDFLGITASGTLQTKQQTLDNLRAGRVHFSTLSISDRKVRFYGTTALVTSLAEVKGTASDGELSGSFRYTHVYARDAHGAWKIVSFEASRIRDTGEHH